MGGFFDMFSRKTPAIETATEVEFEELMFFKKQLQELEENLGEVELVPLLKKGMGGRAGVVGVHRSGYVHCYNRKSNQGYIIKFIFHRDMYSGPGRTDISASVATLSDSILLTENHPTEEDEEVYFTVKTQQLQYERFYHFVEWFCVNREIAQARNKFHENFEILAEKLDIQGETKEIQNLLIQSLTSACAVGFSREQEEYSVNDFKRLFQDYSPFVKCSWQSKAKSARK